MGWINQIPKLAIAVCTSMAALACTAATDSDAKSADTLQQDAAWALVEEYRELRRNCAGLSGEERKACFHELHASNGEYRLAKQQLRLGKTEDLENIHLVTF